MLAERLEDIERRIAAACARTGRLRGEIGIIAVTKTLQPDMINEAIGLGLGRIGENRVQEYLAKLPALQPHEFHLIGHLQRNKVRSILAHCSMIHSVDSARLADEIHRQAGEAQRAVDILLEVNTSGEESKEGVAPEELPALAEHVLSLTSLRLCGLMTVALPADEAEDVRPCFRLLRGLRDELRTRFPGREFPHLSMGMSGDFETAIEEGATFIRLGTALFGARPAV
jgi:PLP dependent protein